MPIVYPESVSNNSLLSEQSGQQRHQCCTDQGDTAACDELLHALGFYSCEIKK